MTRMKHTRLVKKDMEAKIYEEEERESEERLVETD